MADRFLIASVSGSVVAAICCLTPALPLTLGAVGASALIPYVYNDVVLLPLLAGCVILTGVALWRRRSKSS